MRKGFIRNLNLSEWLIYVTCAAFCIPKQRWNDNDSDCIFLSKNDIVLALILFFIFLVLCDHGLYVVYIWNYQFNLSLPLINSFNQTEAVIFPHASYASLGLPFFSEWLQIILADWGNICITTRNIINKQLHSNFKINLRCFVVYLSVPGKNIIESWCLSFKQAVYIDCSPIFSNE